MTEKSEERIYREAKKRINMRKNGVHPSNYFEGWVVDYIDSSTTDKLSVEKLQERCDRYEKALTEISKTKDFYRSGRDHWEEFSQDALKAQKALEAIGGGGCPVGPVGKNGLTKEELEGSGDE
ncbi:hypothetical protein [Lactococcus lactis]|uniref:hypothetical protein n=1 Tax=Lactococcus lactis TaxID=1358 RepID=UPI0022E718FD|nr:hypothetical protein [Lactococcus lactis]